MGHYTTDSAEITKFRPHGRVEISILEAGIVKYFAAGPFNKELAEALAITERKALDIFKIKFGQWSELVVFEDSCMALGDALERLEKHLIDKKRRGVAQLASAFALTPALEGARIMDKQYARCYQNAGIPYQSFSNDTDALQWARQGCQTPKSLLHIKQL